MKDKRDAIYIYTDGSKITDRGFTCCGAVAILYNRETEISSVQLGLGGHMEVFDAEMAALATGASQAAEYIHNHPNTSHITFFTDNATASLQYQTPNHKWPRSSPPTFTTP